MCTVYEPDVIPLREKKSRSPFLPGFFSFLVSFQEKKKKNRSLIYRLHLSKIKSSIFFFCRVMRLVLNGQRVKGNGVKIDDSVYRRLFRFRNRKNNNKRLKKKKILKIKIKIENKSTRRRPLKISIC